MTKRKKSVKSGLRSKPAPTWFQRLSNFFAKIFEAPSQRAAKIRKTKAIREIKSRGYSPFYEKRLLRAVESGKTPSLQAARGHKPGEERARAERERATQGITSAQIGSIRNFFLRWNTHNKSSGEKLPSLEDMIEFAQSNGYSRFAQYREQWNLMRRAYVTQLKNGTYSSKSLAYLERCNEIAQAPTIKWLYYH